MSLEVHTRPYSVGEPPRMWDAVLHKLDQLFLAFFARYRRKKGDAFIDMAWRRAANSVTGYIIFPVGVPLVVVGALFYGWLRIGTHKDHMRILQIVGIVILMALTFKLERRFHKYRSAPPPLTKVESIAERNLIWFARAFSVACIAAVGFGGYVIRQSGSDFLKGF